MSPEQQMSPEDNGAKDRTPILAANWKMNLLRADADTFCSDLRRDLGPPLVEVLIFPPWTLLDKVVRGIDGLSVECGGQDVHAADSGAHTGDVSAAQLADAGCAWALCGHSERRRDHHETNEQVGAKAQAAASRGLTPLICVGETDDERLAGKTFDVLEEQLSAALQPLSSDADLVIAYEPVWAIGTGQTATPAKAQEAHAFLRQRLGELIGADRAQTTRLLYGGSAKPGNVGELIAEADIDGFLVGGASLDSESFLAMIAFCARHRAKD